MFKDKAWSAPGTFQKETGIGILTDELDIEVLDSQ